MIKYLNGKKSKIGYVLYNEFLLNLDTGLPNPFFSAGYFRSNDFSSNGFTINEEESLVLADGYVMGINSYNDIYSSGLSTDGND